MANARSPNGALLRFLNEVALPYEGTGCLMWPFGKAKNGYAMMSKDGRTQYVPDRLIHGTHNRGERQGSHKLTEADVHKIRSLSGRLSQTAIANRFGIDPSTVNNIHSGKRWGWLSADQHSAPNLAARA
jgi:hypothetical protein